MSGGATFWRQRRRPREKGELLLPRQAEKVERICPHCEGRGVLELREPQLFGDGLAVPGLTEKAFQEQTMQMLAWAGYGAYHTWLSLHSAKGFPDTIAYRPAGRTRQSRLVALELKVNEEPTAEQLVWLGAFADARVHPEALLVYPGDAQALVDYLAADQRPDD